MKQVILPGVGATADEEKKITCPHPAGVLWDDFKGHSKAEVKAYCQSLVFLCVDIMGGGLTPEGQPLDKMVNKIVKAYFRDLYDKYIITAELDHLGRPQAPTRQLLCNLGCGGLGYGTKGDCAESVDGVWISK